MKCFVVAAAAAVAAAAPKYYFEDLGPDHVPGVAPRPFEVATGPTESRRLDAHGRMLPPTAGLDVNLYGFTLPTSVVWNAAGTNIYVAEKAGIIKLFHAWIGSGAGRANVALDISERVTSWGDHGLTTIHLSEPPAGGQAYMYMTYMKRDPRFGNVCDDHGQMDGRPLNTVNGCAIFGRFSRFPVHADGSLNAAEEEVILDTENPAPALSKDGLAMGTACCQFSTHSTPVSVVELGGHFYTSLGDGAAFTLVDAGQLGANPCGDNQPYRGAFRSQDPLRLNGKILKWTPAATVAEWQYEVWTVGHRNPFRMSVDTARNRILQTETGWYTVEEINVIHPEESFKGTNMGWPCYEGPEYAPEYLNFFNENPYCTTIRSNSTFYYTHPDEHAGNIASISAVGATADRLYYGDLSQGWIRSVPADTSVLTPVNLAGPAIQDQVVTEMVNVFPCEIKAAPPGVIYVDHFPGAVKSLPGAGVALPSPSAKPIPPYATIHTPNGNDWVAGASITLSSQSNIEGREGAEWKWTAVLLSDCSPAGDCVATSIANYTGSQSFSFTAPSFPGTIEVKVFGRTYGGVSANQVAYLVSRDAAEACTCPGVRSMSVAVPSYSPSAQPVSNVKSAGTSLNVDTKSTGFIAGVATAGAVVGMALIVGGMALGRRFAQPKAAPSRLATSAGSGNTSSNERPLAANAAGRPASSDDMEVVRAKKVKEAGFGPQKAGGAAPAFTSPTASKNKV